MFSSDKADKRAINAGIYAIMKTTKMSKVTIAELKKRLATGMQFVDDDGKFEMI